MPSPINRATTPSCRLMMPAQCLPVCLDDLRELFRIEAQRQRRRLHDIAEHHGELAAFGAARGSAIGMSGLGLGVAKGLNGEVII